MDNGLLSVGALSLRPDRRRAGGTNACARTCARPGPVLVEKQFSLDSDVLFEFNKATLKPAASQALDNLFAQILAANPKDGVATVIGHTDRIGSEAYNQSLPNSVPARWRIISSPKGCLPTRCVPKGGESLRP